jgi:hypothetical protein
MIASCKVFHHTPEIREQTPEGWCVIEYATPDMSKAIIGAFRLAGNGEVERTIKFRGLSRRKHYRLWSDNSDEWIEVSGRELVDRGVLVRLTHALTSELLMASEMEPDTQNA